MPDVTVSAQQVSDTSTVQGFGGIKAINGVDCSRGHWKLVRNHLQIPASNTGASTLIKDIYNQVFPGTAPRNKHTRGLNKGVIGKKGNPMVACDRCERWRYCSPSQAKKYGAGEFQCTMIGAQCTDPCHWIPSDDDDGGDGGGDDGSNGGSDGGGDGDDAARETKGAAGKRRRRRR